MKRILVMIAIAGLASCGGKVKDSDIKTAADAALAGNPAFAGLNVTVSEGVATITGEVKDDAAKAAAESAISTLKGVKSVQNNSTVYVPPPPPPAVPTASEAQAAQLTKAVNDAIKDYPGVKATVVNQVAILTGEIKKSELQKMKMGLSSLKSMGLKNVDSKALVVK